MNHFLIRQKSTSTPLGLLAIASYMQEKGHTVKIVDLTVEKESIEKQIKLFCPDVVGLSVMAALARTSAVKVSKIARKHKKPVVWGGRLPSSLPAECLKESCVDYAVIGEGEVTFAELIEAMEAGQSCENIAGLAYMDQNGVHINQKRTFADLSDFPVTNWNLINTQNYNQKYFSCDKMMYLYWSKGCPGRCTFCYNAQYHGALHRTRPPEYVVAEIEYLVKNCGVDGIYFADEFLRPSKEDMQTFFRLIKEKNLDFRWGGMTRVGAYNKEELQQMYDAGCRWLLFGIESGCAERLKAIKKGVNLEKAKQVFEYCREIGITTQSSFIIGYPGETEDELKETVRFAFSLRANLLPFNGYFPQPDSELYDTLVEKGWFVPPKTLKEWSRFEVGEVIQVNFSKVPRKDLMVLHFYTQWLAFLRKDSVNTEKYGLAKKVAADTMQSIFRSGFSGFFINIIDSVKRFVTVAWYANAYPNILRKYGISKQVKQ